MSDKRKKLEEKELLELLAIAVQNSIEYFVINKDKEFMAKIPKLQQACQQIRNLIQQPNLEDEIWRTEQYYVEIIKVLEEEIKELKMAKND